MNWWNIATTAQLQKPKLLQVLIQTRFLKKSFNGYKQGGRKFNVNHRFLKKWPQDFFSVFSWVRFSQIGLSLGKIQRIWLMKRARGPDYHYDAWFLLCSKVVSSHFWACFKSYLVFSSLAFFSFASVAEIPAQSPSRAFFSITVIVLGLIWMEIKYIRNQWTWPHANYIGRRAFGWKRS